MSWLSKALGGGGSSVPGIDYGSVEKRSTLNAKEQRRLLAADIAKRRTIIGGLGGKLAPLSQQFRTEQGQVGTDLTNRNEAALATYGQDVGKLNEADVAANAAAANVAQERAFRTLPAQQQAIREALAGGGLSRTGAAARQLTQPIQQAARSVSDFGQNLEVNRLANVSRRGENVAMAGLDTRKQVALQRMGLDADTVKYLNSIGRQDLINEASNIAGLSQDEASGLSDINQSLTDTLNQTDIGRQQQAQAQAQAANARRGGVLRSLTGLAGTGIGAAFGGPLGAAIGGQIGQTAGNLVTGQEASFDPTLLFALSQRTPRTRTAVTRSLGRVNTYSPSNSQMGY